MDWDSSVDIAIRDKCREKYLINLTTTDGLNVIKFPSQSILYKKRKLYLHIKTTSLIYMKFIGPDLT